MQTPIDLVPIAYVAFETFVFLVVRRAEECRKWPFLAAGIAGLAAIGAYLFQQWGRVIPSHLAYIAAAALALGTIDVLIKRKGRGKER